MSKIKALIDKIEADFEESTGHTLEEVEDYEHTGSYKQGDIMNDYLSLGQTEDGSGYYVENEVW